jgi:hypothetical protein
MEKRNNKNDSGKMINDITVKDFTSSFVLWLIRKSFVSFKSSSMFF